MKLRLNKASMGKLPDPVREIVQAWRDRHGKAFISISQQDAFYPPEDAKVTMLNTRTGKSLSTQVAGEFAGLTRLSPTARVPLPFGFVAVVEGYFCGVPFLDLYEGIAKEAAPLQINN